jgi:hypothetical protein
MLAVEMLLTSQFNRLFIQLVPSAISKKRAMLAIEMRNP